MEFPSGSKAPTLKCLRRATAPSPSGPRASGQEEDAPQFEVRTRRRLLSVEDGLPPGEIVLDEIAIRPGGRWPPTRLHRVEIEAPEAALATLRPFVERLQHAAGCNPPG